MRISLPFLLSPQRPREIIIMRNKFAFPFFSSPFLGRVLRPIMLSPPLRLLLALRQFPSFLSLFSRFFPFWQMTENLWPRVCLACVARDALSLPEIFRPPLRLGKNDNKVIFMRFQSNELFLSRFFFIAVVVVHVPRWEKWFDVFCGEASQRGLCNWRLLARVSSYWASEVV